MRQTIFAAALVLLLAGTSAAQPPVVTFTPSVGYPTFAKRDPVLRVTPGTTVETRTFSKPGDYYETDKAGPWPGEVGPFYIEGATPDDTLVVRIVRLRPNRDTAISAVNPQGISALFADSRTRMLNDPPPARRWVWRLDRVRNVGMLDLPNSASKRIEIPLAPMLGRVAVAPRGDEEFGGLWPGDFGGNMDAPDIREGATVYLPVFHDGAYSTSATATPRRAMARCGLGPRDDHGRHASVRPDQGQAHPVAAHRERPSTSWSPAACGR